ncbi:MAG TPA: type II toxin-antitoxin system prevent-host-death family antitoxin [Verrucomicrobiales bacterium]|jgi:prevent-host-death family protein|nr:type II toxin-antitoxin system prevent-host-death family antitoxin [Verrucomicrobiales bacterium]
MRIINIQQAKTHLSRYVEEVANGEELIIGKAGKPMAMLVPYKPVKSPRRIGWLKGRIIESPDCWSAKLDAEIAADLGSGKITPDVLLSVKSLKSKPGKVG